MNFSLWDSPRNIDYDIALKWCVPARAALVCSFSKTMKKRCLLSPAFNRWQHEMCARKLMIMSIAWATHRLGLLAKITKLLAFACSMRMMCKLQVLPFTLSSWHFAWSITFSEYFSLSLSLSFVHAVTSPEFTLGRDNDLLAILITPPPLTSFDEKKCQSRSSMWAE